MYHQYHIVNPQRIVGNKWISPSSSCEHFSTLKIQTAIGLMCFFHHFHLFPTILATNRPSKTNLFAGEFPVAPSIPVTVWMQAWKWGNDYPFQWLANSISVVGSAQESDKPENCYSTQAKLLDSSNNVQIRLSSFSLFRNTSTSCLNSAYLCGLPTRIHMRLLRE